MHCCKKRFINQKIQNKSTGRWHHGRPLASGVECCMYMFVCAHVCAPCMWYCEIVTTRKDTCILTGLRYVTWHACMPVFVIYIVWKISSNWAKTKTSGSVLLRHQNQRKRLVHLWKAIQSMQCTCMYAQTMAQQYYPHPLSHQGTCTINTIITITKRANCPQVQRWERKAAPGCLVESCCPHTGLIGHSLRATAGAHLFQKGIDEQLIVCITGHRNTTQSSDCANIKLMIGSSILIIARRQAAQGEYSKVSQTRPGNQMKKPAWIQAIS